MYQLISPKSIAKLISSSSFIIMTFLLVSCGGGGSENTKSDSNIAASSEKKSRVLSAQVTPEQGATEVELNASISATFNTDLIPATLNVNSFSLSRNNNGVAATVSYSEAKKFAELTPTKDLVMMSNYSVVLSKEIAEISGDSLIAKTWSFTTRDGRWDGTASSIENSINAATKPKIVIDKKGNAIAVWLEQDLLTKSFNVKANQYTATTGWSAAELISTDATSGAGIDIAMDSKGNALAVWFQISTKNSNTRIWASRYTLSDTDTGGVWSSAGIIDNNSSSAAAINPKISMDSKGNAIVVWQQQDQNGLNIWANYYTAAATIHWAKAIVIEKMSGDAGVPEISFDSNDDATVIWRHTGTTIAHSIIRVSRYIAGTKAMAKRWLPSVNISKNIFGIVDSPRIVGDSNGTTHAVWSFDDGLTGGIGINIMTAELTAGNTNWNTVKQVSSETKNASHPELSTDLNGNVAAIWQQLSNKTFSIWTNRLSDGKWGIDELITAQAGTSNLANNSIPFPKIILDNNGNAMAVWSTTKTNVESIYASRYLKSNGSWSSAAIINAQQVEAGIAGSAASIALGVNGEMMAVWEHKVDSVSSIYSKSFK